MTNKTLIEIDFPIINIKIVKASDRLIRLSALEDSYTNFISSSIFDNC